MVNVALHMRNLMPGSYSETRSSHFPPRKTLKKLTSLRSAHVYFPTGHKPCDFQRGNRIYPLLLAKGKTVLRHLINVLRHKANEFANSAPSEGASHPSKYTWMRLMIWNMGYCLPFGPNDVTHNSPNWVSGYDHRLLLFSCCQVCGFAGFDPFRTQGAEAAAGECCSHRGRQELKKGKENRAEPLTASPWMDPITYSWVSVIWGWRVGGGGHLLVINMID